MSIQFKLAQSAGKLTQWILKKLNRQATSLPGKIALKIDPAFFDSFKGMRTIMVSGTNGKTLTTSMITHILREQYFVLTNEAGSNMIQGIATTFLNHQDAQIAVLEVDEANLKKLTPSLKPEVIVFTNVFKDQVDRFKDEQATYQLLCDGAKLSKNATIIANGDHPLFNSDNLENKKLFFGFETFDNQTQPQETCPLCNHPLHYNFSTYSNLGDYACVQCGYKRPELSYQINHINEVNKDSSSFSVNHFDFHIKVGGLYNIYNALAAISVGSFFDLSFDQIQAGLNKTPIKLGRQENLKINGQEIILNLVKNPVGFNQVVDLIKLDQEPKSLVILLNDNYADGIDTNWINEANFEKLSTLSIEKTFISGTRVNQLKSRLETANFHQIEAFNTLLDLALNLKEIDSKTIYVLATYTALIPFRDLLLSIENER